MEAKSARLSIILTVLATLVGKELLDEAISITDSLSFFTRTYPSVESGATYAQEGDAADSGDDAEPKERITVGHELSLQDSSVLFANVPPLLVNLRSSSNTPLAVVSFEDQILVPNNPVPLFLTALWSPRKRR